MKAFLKPGKLLPTGGPFTGGPRISATSKEGLTESSKAFDAIAKQVTEERARAANVG